MVRWSIPRQRPGCGMNATSNSPGSVDVTAAGYVADEGRANIARGRGPMQSPHHPQVSKRNDGRWVLNCPECQLDAGNRAVPIGMGLPVESEYIAMRLQENHVGPAHWQRSVHAGLGRRG